MGVNITPQITGQQANDTLSYCFINEPLKVFITPVTLATGQGAYTLSGNTITGTGTLFTLELVVGNIITLGLDEYEVATIASNTSLTITTTFDNTSASSTIITTFRAMLIFQLMLFKILYYQNIFINLNFIQISQMLKLRF